MVLPAWRVLVVDNNEDLCLSAVSSLKEIGISAHWATDGKKAVEMVRKCHDEGQDYEVVLLDWKMPEMDGLHTAREMRKLLGQRVPILIISAYDWSDIEEEAKEVGIQGFISKPLFKSNLYLGKDYEGPRDGASCRQGHTPGRGGVWGCHGEDPAIRAVRGYS